MVFYFIVQDYAMTCGRVEGRRLFEGDLVEIRLYLNDILVGCTGFSPLLGEEVQARGVRLDVRYGGPSGQDPDTWSRIKVLFR